MKFYFGFLVLFFVVRDESAYAASAPVLSPAAEVAKAYYLALNAQDPSKLKSFYSADYIMHLKSFPTAQQKLIEEGYPASRLPISTVEVTQDIADGAKAHVHVLLHYQDGTAQAYSADLIQESGSWKISWE